MGQGRAQIYNLISIVFVVLTIGVVVLVVSHLAAPPPAPTQVAFAVPTSAILPSATPTPTITPSYTPTDTDTPIPPTETLTPTITPSITWTQIPTFTPSLTFTIAPTGTIAPTATNAPTATDSPIPPSGTILPSLTITNTLAVTPTQVPSDTPTLGTFTQEPTQPPPSPFPFELRDNQVIYTTNFANTAGCAWQGVGGQVFDLNNQPLTQMRVHVFGNGIDLYTASGSNTLYGLSGWEVPLGTTVSSSSFIVELQSAQGTIISPQITVTFPANCSQNLALVSFQQTRPF